MATVRVEFRSGRDAKRLADLARAAVPLAARELDRTATRYGLAGELGADEVEVIAGLDLPEDLRGMVDEWVAMARRAAAFEDVRPRAYDVIQRARQRLTG